MQTLVRVMAIAATLAIAPAATAALSVDSMNFPAWVERGTDSIPLAPGDRLETGDVVRTGPRGRAWLEAEDGSVIKLGQGTHFVVDRERLEISAAETFYDAAFRVLRGAFRFTGSFFARAQELPHRLDFQVGAITAGVRGTDIWGRSGEEEDFVALLEGRIEVSSNGDTPQLMTEPLTLYRKQQARTADDVAPVSLAVVQELAPQTELSIDAGIAGRDGNYDLVLASVPGNVFDRASLDRFRRAGYPAEAVSAEVGDNTYIRIMLRGLVDLQAARNLSQTVAAEFSIDDAWIHRRN